MSKRCRSKGARRVDLPPIVFLNEPASQLLLEAVEMAARVFDDRMYDEQDKKEETARPNGKEVT